VNALDHPRAATREPESVDVLFSEIRLAAGGDPRLDDAAHSLEAELADHDELELRARRVVELAALCLAIVERHRPRRLSAQL
jgi:putative acyl-CoA dehydrogenase